MNAQQHVLVIFSGGQDSTTCLLQAIDTYGADAVHAITFDYGQRHKLEVEIAQEIAQELHIADHKIMDATWYKELTHNALMDTTTPIDKAPGAIAPNTFVEGRNALFLLMAAVYAKSQSINRLIIGVSDADYSGYPDCREVFVKSMNDSINLAMAWDCQIIAPLQHLTKAEVWALADSLGKLDFIRTRTLTCYNGTPGDGCGECPACKLRSQGLAEYLASK